LSDHGYSRLRNARNNAKPALRDLEERDEELSRRLKVTTTAPEYPTLSCYQKAEILIYVKKRLLANVLNGPNILTGHHFRLAATQFTQKQKKYRPQR